MDLAMKNKVALVTAASQGIGQAVMEDLVYDPDSGKTYKCKLKLIDHNTLEIRGYIGISLLGRSETWTRRTDQDSAEQDAVGARGGTRTHTSFRTTDFKSVASTSSATRA